MQEKILEYLSHKQGGDDVHGIMDHFGVSDLKEVIIALNDLEDRDMIYRDEDDVYHDLIEYGIKEGTVIIRFNGTSFIEKEEGKIKDLNSALPLDTVWYKREKGGIRIIKVLKRYTKYITGNIYYYRHSFHFKVDDERYKGFKITNFKEFKLKDHSAVRCVITDFINKEMKIDMMIGMIDDPRISEKMVVARSGVPVAFSEAVLKEAKRLKLDIDDRKDLSDLLTITIDGDTAKDFDDAISIVRDDKGYVLYVHIADVSYYVKEGSVIDKSARERGTSIYYTDQVIPMLPEELSNDLCSLRPNEPRLTLTVEIHYDDKGEVLDTSFYPSLIRSDFRMTYSDVNKILEKDQELCDKYQVLVSMIADALALSDKLRAKRDQNGAISFDDDETEFVLSDGKVIDIKKRQRGRAELIIEDFMIAANVEVARYMHYLDLPMIYRDHDKPKEDKMMVLFDMLYTLGYKIKGDHYTVYPKQLQDCLRYFKDTELESVISKLMLRAMAKAIYDDTCTGHFGLALSDYCHFTSPIRRYPDLMVHRMLRKYVFKGNYDEYDKDKKRMHDIAVKCSDTEKRAVQIERDIRDARCAEYMLEHIGEVYDGIISGVTGHGLYVKLANTVEGLVSIGDLDGYWVYDEKTMTLVSNDKIYRLGDKVRVEVIENFYDHQGVYFRIYGKGKRDSE